MFQPGLKPTYSIYFGQDYSQSQTEYTGQAEDSSDQESETDSEDSEDEEGDSEEKKKKFKTQLRSLQKAYDVTGLDSIRDICVDQNFEVHRKAYTLRFPNTSIRMVDVLNTCFVFDIKLTRSKAKEFEIGRFETLVYKPKDGQTLPKKERDAERKRKRVAEPEGVAAKKKK